MWKKLLLVMICAAFAACKSGSTEPKTVEEQAMPVGALMSEYSTSKEATVRKYTGKTLTVKGHTLIPPSMPKGADDAGILTLKEKGSDGLLYLTCNFTQAEKAEFTRITGDQMVTVKGIFDDDTSTALKSCRLVDVEK